MARKEPRNHSAGEARDPEAEGEAEAEAAVGGVSAEERAEAEPSGLEGDAARLAHARALEEAGELAAAVEVYRELLLEDPGYVAARMGLGRLYEHTGQPAQALEEFEAARQVEPDNVEIVTHVGAALGALGRFDQAERELKRALRLEPARAETHAALGVLAFKRGSYAQAELELKRALELDPSPRAVIYFYRGEALNQLGRVDEALDMLTRAVELDPRNARAYYTMGILYDRKHQRDEAAAMYRKSREVGSA